jgi:uncharacterized membrane protein YphA (DoxX/SURF4 family)
MVSGVFVSEGIQKFLFPSALGVGRFAQIGIPAPEIMAPFVGIVEIGCGFLILLGLWTRMAAVPLIVDMGVAIATTKVPILLKSGFWSMAHEARTASSAATLVARSKAVFPLPPFCVTNDNTRIQLSCYHFVRVQQHDCQILQGTGNLPAAYGHNEVFHSP